MKMYGAVCDNNVVAMHERKKVIKKFINAHGDKKMSMVEIKKKARDKYTDLYLVKVGGRYIPAELYGIAKELDDEWRGEIKSIIESLNKFALIDDLSEKDKKAFKRVKKYLKNKLSEGDEAEYDIDTLYDLRQCKDHIRDIMEYDYGEAKY